MSDKKKKRGRPIKDGSKRKDIHIRITDEQYEQIKFVCETRDISVTSALLEGLKLSYNLAKYSEK